MAQTVKHLPTMQETRVRSLVLEDPLEKEMATHSSILAWKIPWTEEPGWLLSMGSQRVRHNWATSLFSKSPIQIWNTNRTKKKPNEKLGRAVLFKYAPSTVPKVVKVITLYSHLSKITCSKTWPWVFKGEMAPKWVEYKAFLMPDIKLKKQTTTTKQDF